MSGLDQTSTATQVMTWSLCAPCRTGSSACAAEIARHRPDVLGVQEACSLRLRWVLHRLDAAHGLRYHVVRAPIRHNLRCGPPVLANFGNALLSRTPITEVEIVHYTLGGSERRGYLSATTMIDGRPTRVFVTHLAQAAQADVRATQVVELVQAVAAHDSVVVLGDFNTEPFNPEMRPVWDVLRDVDPHCGAEPDPGLTPTANASPHRKKFDYVLHRGLTCATFRVTGSRHSDHDMVAGYLRHPE